MGFYDVIPLFVDTNLGTHFALSVSQDITAGDLKGKLIMEHFSCFPNLGKIKVHGLMVKKKSFFYHLSDSMAIKHVFEELSGTWLLHLNASSMQNALEDRSLSFSNSSPHCDNQTKKSVRIDCCQAFQNDRSTVSEHPIEGKVHESLSSLENSRKKSNQTISVTGIISRFFSELDEVDSFYCQHKHIHETVHVCADELRDSNIRTLASQPDHISNRKTAEFDTDIQCYFAKKKEKNVAKRAKVASKVKMKQLGSKKLVNKKSSLCTPHKSCNYRVGKRLVQAANSIQISGNGKKSTTKFLSKCKSSDSAAFVRRIAYDVDDFID
ncbi:hypothetical protein KFK09_028618 [Dendrobium nobile]|uniref:Uncharacterized protein n=1 Tax=Dendrobium nobile TaxID=94219 RepID=A0A8T3A3S8_DENNO|nr:hypothetical protein KFK09_028618 [Dendrobium nobile]